MALAGLPPNADFLAKALHIQTEILSATTQHDLRDIRCQWSIIEKQYQLALKGGKISLSMKDRVACISKRISLLFQSFSDVVSKTADLEPNYLEVLNDPHLTPDSPITLNSWSTKPFLQSLGHPKSSPKLPRQESTSAYDPTPLPEFIEHAYKHFVANIHNPYPSREEKQAIVDMSNNPRVTLTSVSNWFTNARRRCGWAEILKSRCKGNREEMIDISKRIFVKEDPDRPVDPQIIAEFMEMKRNVETMYEKKTRTSAWIEDLDLLVDAISSEKHRDLGNPQVKKKIQAETLCKINRAPRQVQRDQERQNGLSRTASLSSFTSSGSTIDNDESTSESIPVFDSKHKNSLEDNNFLRLRDSSPASSLSSFSFVSDSSDSRVPSLSWSDSGDEERPRKRPRSNANISTSSSPVPSELPFPLDSSFGWNLSSPLSNNLSIIQTRGQKRRYDANLDPEVTPTAKRIRSETTQVSQVTIEVASPTPTHDTSATDFTSSHVTSTTPYPRRSSITLADFDSLLTLGAEEPQPVEIAPPDTSIPLEVGVFDWSNPLDPFDLTGGLVTNVDSTASSENPSTDFSQLFQLFTGADVEFEMTTPLSDKTGIDAGIESPPSHSALLAAQLPYGTEQPPSHSLPDVQIDLPSLDLPCLFPENHPQSSPPDAQDLMVDLTELASNPVSMQTFDRFEFDYSTQAPTSMQTSAVLPNTLRNSLFETSQSGSVTPTWISTSVPPTPETQEVLPADVPSLLTDSNTLSIDLTGKDLTLVEKALRKEYRRRELEQKKAALERELEELERE